jgi:5-methylcytosine-specific restriction endonuclease McrA
MIYPCPKPKPGRPKSHPKDGRVILRGKHYTDLLAFVYERDSRVCHICGEYVRSEDKSLDHLKNRKMGGGSRDDSANNVKLAHIVCNTERGSKPLGL